MEEKNGRKKLGKINPEKNPGNFLLENLPINLLGNYSQENKGPENKADKKTGISRAEYISLFQRAIGWPEARAQPYTGVIWGSL